MSARTTFTTPAATPKRPAFIISSLNSRRVAKDFPSPARRPRISAVRSERRTPIVKSTSTVKSSVIATATDARVARVTPAQIKLVLDRSKTTPTAVVVPVPAVVVNKAASTTFRKERSLIPRVQAFSGAVEVKNEKRSKAFAEFVQGKTTSRIPRLAKYVENIKPVEDAKKTEEDAVVVSNPL